MEARMVCLVTIHGIGFEQPPLVGEAGYPDTPGYADNLHEYLSKYLDESWLCDDPQRQRSKHGENGPIYVQSAWPPDSYCIEAGLSRLGSWDEQHSTIIVGPKAQLCNGAGRIAHVALVYSQQEGQGPQVDASLITGAMASVSLGHYTHVINLVRAAFLDTQPLWKNLATPVVADSPPSLRTRQDPGLKRQHVIPAHVQQPGGLMAILRQMENDVAAYVCHNEMRERIRGFVYDALLRLACRDDVAGIIINGHSNGTVIAFDALEQMPPFAARKIWAIVTAGSPLRKYTDLFNWGYYLPILPKLTQWLNFLDLKDPVADPLVPNASWICGEPLQEEMMTGLYQELDANTGTFHRLPIEDIVVDNLKYSRSGGLQAHNYWDNEVEFVSALAELLRQQVSSGSALGITLT